MTDIDIQLKYRREKLIRRKKRIHKKILGTSERPRLVVFRSNKNIYAQIVDDITGRTITGCSSLTPAIKEKIKDIKGNIEVSKLVGKHIAELALAKGIDKVSFDRNGRRYHGRVKAVAEGAREGGLNL